MCRSSESDQTVPDSYWDWSPTSPDSLKRNDSDTNCSGLCAMRFTNGQEDLNFLYTDHLGAIVTITDNTGTVVHEQSFDPCSQVLWSCEGTSKLQPEVAIPNSLWEGRCRNTSDWSYENPDPNSAWAWFSFAEVVRLKADSVDRGYTGHAYAERSRSKMLPEFGLINMNRPQGAHGDSAESEVLVAITYGRAYDPVLGRMLQVDKYVQDPYSSQSYNRYSYTWNNPLKYTDPSGEIIVPMLIGAAISVVTNGISNGFNGRSFFQGAGKAALIGAIGGAASFGIGQAAAGISGFGKVGFQAFSHGLLGGAMSELSGGDFRSGLVSGMASSLTATGTNSLLGKMNLKPSIKGLGVLASGGIVGGTAAKADGGDFWDGARNVAISAGLNHAIHTGAFGSGVMMAAISGRTRHLFLADAGAFSATIDVIGIHWVTGEAGGLLVYRGDDARGFFPFEDGAYGIGFDFGVGIEFVEFYYAGPVSDITADTFLGDRIEFNLSASFPGVSAGITGSFATDSNNKVYGIGYTFGAGPKTFQLGGWLNVGTSKKKEWYEIW